MTPEDLDAIEAQIRRHQDASRGAADCDACVWSAHGGPVPVYCVTHAPVGAATMLEVIAEVRRLREENRKLWAPTLTVYGRCADCTRDPLPDAQVIPLQGTAP